MATTINEEDNEKFKRQLSQSSYGKYIEWGAGPKAARRQLEREILENNHKKRIEKRKPNFEAGTF